MYKKPVFLHGLQLESIISLYDIRFARVKFVLVCFLQGLNTKLINEVSARMTSYLVHITSSCAKIMLKSYMVSFFYCCKTAMKKTT